MGDYIEKQATLDAILGEPPDAHYPSWYAEKIKALPAADVVPVVRCKDCENAQNECGGMIICRVHRYITCLNDFCNYGKEKDGGADDA